MLYDYDVQFVHVSKLCLRNSVIFLPAVLETIGRQITYVAQEINCLPQRPHRLEDDVGVDVAGRN